MMSDKQTIKAVLFDLDGTLLNTSEGIACSVLHTLSVMQLPSISSDEVSTFIGPPIQESLKRHFRLSDEDVQKGADIFRAYYKDCALFKAALYPGIIDLLKQLKQKGFLIGVATYKREDYAMDILKHFGILEYCDVVHGADNDNKLRKSDIVYLCISEMSVDNSEVVLVGDTYHDLEGAEEADIHFIAVTYGFGFRESVRELSRKNVVGVADNPMEIEGLLK